MAGCFTWNRRRCSAAYRRASKPRGSPGWADRGRAPRLDARRVGHANRPGRPWAAAAFRCSARRPGMPGCFTWNRRQCPGGRVRRIRTPRPVCLDEGTCGGARRSVTRRSGPPGFTWNRAGLQLPAVAGRSGCPDGPDVSRGTGSGVGRDDALRFGRPDRMSRRGTAAIRYSAALVDPDAHSRSGFTWNCAGAPGPAPQTRTSGRLDVSRGTGRPASGRTTPPVRTPGPDESRETCSCVQASRGAAPIGPGRRPSGCRTRRAGLDVSRGTGTPVCGGRRLGSDARSG